MRRKVVKLGPATLVVSLPSKWTKKFSINAGDELEMEEHNKNLIISTEKGINIEKEAIDISNWDHLTKRIVAAKYLKGCDEIEVKINSLAKSRKIQARVDDMIGVEIIEQSKDKLLLKDMGGGGEDNFDSILKRVIFLLHTLAEESHKAIKAKDTDLEYLKDVELNINKFTEYCIRLLNKQNYPDTRKTAVLYCTVFLLEQLGDEYKKLVSYINDNKIKLNNNLIELYDVIFKYHLQMEQMFLKFSYEKAIELSKERDNIIEKIEHLLKTSKSNTYIIILKNYENITETIIKIMNELMNLN